MADLNDLANQMGVIAAKLPTFGNETAKDVALTILSDLTQVTPVDVGTALSNWQVSLDVPALLEIPAYSPSPKGRTKQGQWTHAVDPVSTAQANVQPTLDAGQAILQGKQPGQDIYITNNVPYIWRLDQGSSSQAPAGFVDRAILLGTQVVGRARFVP